LRYWRIVANPRCSHRSGWDEVPTFVRIAKQSWLEAAPLTGSDMEFKRIVVGIDFSANSLAAARWVAHHFAPDADLVLTHVVAKSSVLSLSERHMPRTLDELRVVTPHVQGGLQALAELLGAGPARTEILSGDPAEVLAFTAAHVGADLICVGSSAHRRGSARFGATTPHRLIARTDVPVLVAPRVPSGAPSRILVPFDDRATGKIALQTAARLATAYEASLDALYVIETDTRDAFTSNPETLNVLTFFRAQQWAAEVIDDLALPSARAVSFVRPGDAGAQTISHAHRSDCNLIVMGTGERTSAPRGCKYARHVGSTTRFVIWAAPCPVLALPPGAAAENEPVRPARGFASAMMQLERDDLLAEADRVGH
jgi:nucleotide-binding universal stress UspA family protein